MPVWASALAVVCGESLGPAAGCCWAVLTVINASRIRNEIPIHRKRLNLIGLTLLKTWSDQPPARASEHSVNLSCWFYAHLGHNDAPRLVVESPQQNSLTALR